MFLLSLGCCPCGGLRWWVVKLEGEPVRSVSV